MKYSYARHAQAFRESYLKIPAIAHPTDLEFKDARKMYALRRGWFTTEDFLRGIGVSLFITAVLASNGWSHQRRLQQGQVDSLIHLVSRIFVWFLVGFLLLGLCAHAATPHETNQMQNKPLLLIATNLTNSNHKLPCRAAAE